MFLNKHYPYANIQIITKVIFQDILNILKKKATLSIKPNENHWFENIQLNFGKFNFFEILNSSRIFILQTKIIAFCQKPTVEF